MAKRETRKKASGLHVIVIRCDDGHRSFRKSSDKTPLPCAHCGKDAS